MGIMVQVWGGRRGKLQGEGLGSCTHLHQRIQPLLHPPCSHIQTQFCPLLTLLLSSCSNKYSKKQWLPHLPKITTDRVLSTLLMDILQQQKCLPLSLHILAGNTIGQHSTHTHIAFWPYTTYMITELFITSIKYVFVPSQTFLKWAE